MGIFSNNRKELILKKVDLGTNNSATPVYVELIDEGKVVGKYDYLSDWIDHLPHVTSVPGYRVKWDMLNPSLDSGTLRIKTVKVPVTISFVFHDGHIEKMEYTSDWRIHVPPNTPVDGLCFRWDLDNVIETPGADLVVTQTVEPVFTVEYYFDGKKVKSDRLHKGDRLDYPPILPEKGYRVGWASTESPDGSVVVNGNFNPVKISVPDLGIEFDYSPDWSERLDALVDECFRWEYMVPEESSIDNEDVVILKRDIPLNPPVKFIVDGIPVSETVFESEDRVILPEIPVKPGYRVVWDRSAFRSRVYEGHTEPIGVHFVFKGEEVAIYRYSDYEGGKVPDVSVDLGYEVVWDEVSEMGIGPEDIFIQGKTKKKVVKVDFMVDSLVVDSVRCPAFSEVPYPDIPPVRGRRLVWDTEPDTSRDSVCTGHTEPIILHFIHDGVELCVRDYESLTPGNWPDVPCGYEGSWIIPCNPDSSDVNVYGSFKKRRVKVGFIVDSTEVYSIECYMFSKIVPRSIEVKKGFRLVWDDVPDTSRDSVCRGHTEPIGVHYIYAGKEVARSDYTEYLEGNFPIVDVDPGYTVRWAPVSETNIGSEDISVYGELREKTVKIDFFVDSVAVCSVTCLVHASVPYPDLPLVNGRRLVWDSEPDTSCDSVCTGHTEPISVRFILNGREIATLDYLDYLNGVFPDIDVGPEYIVLWDDIPKTEVYHDDVCINGRVKTRTITVDFAVDNVVKTTLSCSRFSKIEPPDLQIPLGYRLVWDSMLDTSRNSVCEGHTEPILVHFILDGKEIGTLRYLEYLDGIRPDVDIGPGRTVSWNDVPKNIVGSEDISVHGKIKTETVNVTFIIDNLAKTTVTCPRFSKINHPEVDQIPGYRLVWDSIPDTSRNSVCKGHTEPIEFHFMYNGVKIATIDYEQFIRDRIPEAPIESGTRLKWDLPSRSDIQSSNIYVYPRTPSRFKNNRVRVRFLIEGVLDKVVECRMYDKISCPVPIWVKPGYKVEWGGVPDTSCDSVCVGRIVPVLTRGLLGSEQGDGEAVKAPDCKMATDAGSSGTEPIFQNRFSNGRFQTFVNVVFRIAGLGDKTLRYPIHSVVDSIGWSPGNGWKIVLDSKPDTSKDSECTGHVEPILVHLIHQGKEVAVREYRASGLVGVPSVRGDSGEEYCWNIPKLYEVGSEDLYLESVPERKTVTVRFFVDDMPAYVAKCRQNDPLDWPELSLAKNTVVDWSTKPNTSKNSICVGYTRYTGGKDNRPNGSNRSGTNLNLTSKVVFDDGYNKTVVQASPSEVLVEPKVTVKRLNYGYWKPYTLSDRTVYVKAEYVPARIAYHLDEGVRYLLETDPVPAPPVEDGVWKWTYGDFNRNLSVVDASLEYTPRTHKIDFVFPDHSVRSVKFTVRDKSINVPKKSDIKGYKWTYGRYDLRFPCDQIVDCRLEPITIRFHLISGEVRSCCYDPDSGVNPPDEPGYVWPLIVIGSEDIDVYPIADVRFALFYIDYRLKFCVPFTSLDRTYVNDMLDGPTVPKWHGRNGVWKFYGDDHGNELYLADYTSNPGQEPCLDGVKKWDIGNAVNLYNLEIDLKPHSVWLESTSFPTIIGFKKKECGKYRPLTLIPWLGREKAEWQCKSLRTCKIDGRNGKAILPKLSVTYHNHLLPVIEFLGEHDIYFREHASRNMGGVDRWDLSCDVQVETPEDLKKLYDYIFKRDLPPRTPPHSEYYTLKRKVDENRVNADIDRAVNSNNRVIKLFQAKYLPECTFEPVDEDPSKVVLTEYLGADEEFIIPSFTLLSEDAESSDVVSVGEQAFWCNEDLRKVTISDGIETICDSAFYGCTGLNEVELPKSLREIRGGAFGKCRSLVSIEIPSNVEMVEQDSFTHLKEAIVRCPKGSIEEGAFPDGCTVRFMNEVDKTADAPCKEVPGSEWNDFVESLSELELEYLKLLVKGENTERLLKSRHVSASLLQSGINCKFSEIFDDDAGIFDEDSLDEDCLDEISKIIGD